MRLVLYPTATLLLSVLGLLQGSHAESSTNPDIRMCWRIIEDLMDSPTSLHPETLYDKPIDLPEPLASTFAEIQGIIRALPNPGLDLSIDATAQASIIAGLDGWYTKLDAIKARQFSSIHKAGNRRDGGVVESPPEVRRVCWVRRYGKPIARTVTPATLVALPKSSEAAFMALGTYVYAWVYHPQGLAYPMDIVWREGRLHLITELVGELAVPAYERPVEMRMNALDLTYRAPPIENARLMKAIRTAEPATLPVATKYSLLRFIRHAGPLLEALDLIRYMGKPLGALVDLRRVHVVRKRVGSKVWERVKMLPGWVGTGESREYLARRSGGGIASALQWDHGVKFRVAGKPSPPPKGWENEYRYSERLIHATKVYLATALLLQADPASFLKMKSLPERGKRLDVNKAFYDLILEHLSGEMMSVAPRVKELVFLRKLVHVSEQTPDQFAHWPTFLEDVFNFPLNPRVPWQTTSYAKAYQPVPEDRHGDKSSLSDSSRSRGSSSSSSHPPTSPTDDPLTGKSASSTDDMLVRVHRWISRRPSGSGNH